MHEQLWFIPGRPGVSDVPLARYRPIQPVGAARAYVQHLTKPGDLVVDLFCQGPTIAREAATSGRRVLGFSVNPLLLLTARLGLERRPTADINAAFTRLADGPKGDVLLRQHLSTLYDAPCPACGRPGTALWFAWDRDGKYPFKKAVRCPNCGQVQEGPADGEDAAFARRTPARGLSYYYALDRVAPPGHPARERAAELVELYTPRNLSALIDLAMRLEDLQAGEEVKAVLAGVLLDCFDAGSNLDPADDERPRPRTLRVPSVYLERNVWLCFEEGLSRLLARPAPLPLEATADATTLVRGEAPGYALVSHAARDVRRVIEPGSVSLILVDPPRPDAVFWALSALWGGWLWDSPAVRAMRPFLRRRRFDWEWHWHVLRAALQAVGTLLTPQGHLVALFSESDETLLESMCLAASGAGYSLEGWGTSAEVGHRFVWRWKGAPPPPAPDPETMAGEVEAGAERALVVTLRERGEPAAWPLLHAGAYAALVETGTLARAGAMPKGDQPLLTLAADAVRRASRGPALVRLAPEADEEVTSWWLADAHGAADSLGDRIEARVRTLLGRRPAWKLEPLVHAVYAAFDGPLTPDLGLVLTCADSYGVQEGGSLHLRPEDDPARRARETLALCADLVTLGERLGFLVVREGSWDVRWLEEGKETYVFAVTPTAELARHLLAGWPAAEGARRCLVLPGGRAQLATFRLQRDPRLVHCVDKEGWQFVKFRLLRHLIAEEALERHALKTVLGLDPIAEQEAAQIPLF